MDFTVFLRLYVQGRQKGISAYTDQAELIQRNVLAHLINTASQTEWGRQYHYGSAFTYEDFKQLPLQCYDDIKGHVDRMRHGEPNVLWPGQVKWYAKSSGTTSDKSKFIPVSPEGLKRIHYAGGTDCLSIYLKNHPQSHVFAGKALILGGSHSPNYNLRHSLVGDLSAILIENINPLVNLFRIPSKEIALLSDFEEKRERIAQIAANQNITNLSGVPSWMLSVLTRVMEIKGTDNLAKIWPNLEVFFHGGVAFTPYREQYRQIIDSPKMHYMETYNASEGFFGIQDDPDDPAMLLMIDYDVFYEFIPMDQLDSPNAQAIPLWEVEVGTNYAMVISTSCGLWRYMIGDTVKFTSTKPYKFIISGRTKHFINAFGEELMVDNAEQGLKKVCQQTGAQILDYTAAPVFMDDNAHCRHQWLIEFNKEPGSLDEFARLLDEALQQINSDYEAKRHKNITLQPLEIIKARHGLFHDWLKGKGKLGGQHKIPRLCNNREYIDDMLKLNNQ